MATDKDKYRRLAKQAPKLISEGVTQIQIAIMFGVSRSLVSRVLSGKNHPKWYEEEQDGEKMGLE